MAQLVEAEALDKKLQQELKQYSDSDPTLLEGQSGYWILDAAEYEIYWDLNILTDPFCLFAEKYSMIAKEAANRWTGKRTGNIIVTWPFYSLENLSANAPIPTYPRRIENIFTFQSYCVNKFNVDRQEFNRNFHIDDEMDTLP